MKISLFLAAMVVLPFQLASAILVTDPDDPRDWQGATVGTFATLYYGADTLANRQLVVDNQLLDDGIFDPTNFIPSTLITSVGNYSGQGGGTSLDLIGTGTYDYTCCGAPATRFDAANAIDEHWMQTGGVVGDTVWDLGFLANKAAIFNTIDHGPLPQEAIESTVYLSDTPTGPWVEAAVERVWLEGFLSNIGIKWDGFAYAVGTGTTDTFRYASIIHGGPGALINDGDNEINGILGTRADFTIPEPTSTTIAAVGVIFSVVFARRVNRN